MKNKTFNIPLLFLVLVISACSPINKATDTSIPQLSAIYADIPLIIRDTYNEAIQIRIYVNEGKEVNYKSVQCLLDENAVNALERIDVYIRKDNERFFLTGATLLGSVKDLSGKVNIPIDINFKAGLHTIWISPVLKSTADLTKQLTIRTFALSKGMQIASYI